MTNGSHSVSAETSGFARFLTIAMLVFGAVATLVGGVGASGALIRSATASGCAVMTSQVFGVGAALLAAVGALHLVLPWLYLRAPRR